MHMKYGKVRSPCPTQMWLLVQFLLLLCVIHVHLKLRDDDSLEKFPLTYKFTIKNGQWLKMLYVIIQVFPTLPHMWNLDPNNFLHPWTFENINSRWGYIFCINNIIDNQLFFKLGCGVIIITRALTNQNSSTRLLPHLHSTFIQILDVV